MEPNEPPLDPPLVLVSVHPSRIQTGSPPLGSWLLAYGRGWSLPGEQVYSHCGYHPHRLVLRRLRISRSLPVVPEAASTRSASVRA